MSRDYARRFNMGDIEGRAEVLTIPHDYVVTKVARSPNAIQYVVVR